MNDESIPIDIHTNKLLDWLISRRHCSKDWPKNILIIREKISNAIQDMPGHDGIVQLLSGTHINYFHCLKIVEILKETEADSKNLFGRYGSQRMKDWLEIIRLYEQDNIYLAEAAQMLTRNISYEIPGIKKQIAKLEQLQTECSKKENDYGKAEKSIRNEFANECKQLGIAGKHIKHELIALINELPSLFEAAAKSAHNLSPSIELYKAFLEFTSGGHEIKTPFPLLTYVIEHGNTTTYEWTYGEVPLKIEEAQSLLLLESDKNVDNNKIDYGDTVSETIDFGDDKLEVGEIDFGNGETGDIDWGNDGAIEVVDDSTIDFNINLEESGIIIEDSGVQGGVATGTDALTILDNPTTRNQYINELMELEAFLIMRLYELSTTSSMDALSQLQATGSAILQLQTTESVTALLTAVQGALTLNTNPRIQHLHSVKHSPKYVDYLAFSLNQKLTAAEKTRASQQVVAKRRLEAVKQVENLKPILQTIIDKTKQLQQQIEQDISKKYKNRQVNLMGGINVL